MIASLNNLLSFEIHGKTCIIVYSENNDCVKKQTYSSNEWLVMKGQSLLVSQAQEL